MEQEPIWKRAFNAIDSNKGEVAGLGTEVAAGLALDAKTAKLLLGGPLGWAAYGAINFGGGASANIAAQKLRGEEDLNWGEVISSGLLGIIPFTSLRFGKKATKLMGRPGTFQRAITGGAGMGASDRFIQSGINEGELPSASDVAIGALTGGAFGGSLQQAGKTFASKNLQSQIIKAQQEGRVEDLQRLVFDFRKTQKTSPELDQFNSFDEYIQRRANITAQAINSINGGNVPSRGVTELIKTVTRDYEQRVLYNMGRISPNMRDGIFDYNAFKNSAMPERMSRRKIIEEFITPPYYKETYGAVRKNVMPAFKQRYSKFLTSINLDPNVVQLHHITALADSIPLYDGLRFNSPEWWELTELLLKAQVRPGTTQYGGKGWSLPVVGNRGQYRTPHGIVHLFYDDKITKAIIKCIDSLK